MSLARSTCWRASVADGVLQETADKTGDARTTSSPVSIAELLTGVVDDRQPPTSCFSAIWRRRMWLEEAGGRQFWQEDRAAKAKPSADGIYQYRARKAECDACQLRSQCRPGAVGRKALRSSHEGACDLVRDLSKTDAILPLGASGRRSECCSLTSNAS